MFSITAGQSGVSQGHSNEKWEVRGGQSGLYYKNFGFYAIPLNGIVSIKWEAIIAMYACLSRFGHHSCPSSSLTRGSWTIFLFLLITNHISCFWLSFPSFNNPTAPCLPEKQRPDICVSQQFSTVDLSLPVSVPGTYQKADSVASLNSIRIAGVEVQESAFLNTS